MAALCVTPIKGRVIRIQKLDVCGNPVTGAGNVSVSDGFIMVHPSPDYEDGVEFTKRRADGALCVNQKDPGQLKRVKLEITWCVMDPDVITLETGSREILTTATGTGVFFNDSLITARHSVEVWQSVTGRGACDPTTGLQRYVYWAFPNVSNTQVQDFQMENDSLEWKSASETAAVGSSWGTFPTTLPPNGYLSGSTFAVGDHYAFNITTVAPPAAACGAVSLT
jgi:hypothetical protein